MNSSVVANTIAPRRIRAKDRLTSGALSLIPLPPASLVRHLMGDRRTGLHKSPGYRALAWGLRTAARRPAPFQDQPLMLKSVASLLGITEVTAREWVRDTEARYASLAARHRAEVAAWLKSLSRLELGESSPVNAVNIASWFRRLRESTRRGDSLDALTDVMSHVADLYTLEALREFEAKREATMQREHKELMVEIGSLKAASLEPSSKNEALGNAITCYAVRLARLNPNSDLAALEWALKTANSAARGAGIPAPEGFADIP